MLVITRIIPALSINLDGYLKNKVDFHASGWTVSMIVPPEIGATKMCRGGVRFGRLRQMKLIRWLSVKLGFERSATTR